MIEGFTLLAFGFCAGIAEFHGQIVLDLGYVTSGECKSFVYIGDSEGSTANIRGHEIGVKVLDGDGIEVAIDDLKFIIPKTIGI